MKVRKRRLTKRQLFPEFFRHLDYVIGELRSETTKVRVLKALGPLPFMGRVYVSNYDKQIELSATGSEYTKDLLKCILSRMKVIVDIVHDGRCFEVFGVKRIKAVKSFSPDTGKVSYSVCGPIPGWTIVVSGEEPRCKVKLVESQVNHPARMEPAYTETVKRYELENPEECLGTPKA